MSLLLEMSLRHRCHLRAQTRPAKSALCRRRSRSTAEMQTCSSGNNGHAGIRVDLLGRLGDHHSQLFLAANSWPGVDHAARWEHSNCSELARLHSAATDLPAQPAAAASETRRHSARCMRELSASNRFSKLQLRNTTQKIVQRTNSTSSSKASCSKSSLSNGGTPRQPPLSTDRSSLQNFDAKTGLTAPAGVAGLAKPKSKLAQQIDLTPVLKRCRILMQTSTTSLFERSLPARP